MIPVALSIAGSDPSGGAGIQADLKTFQRFGVYGQAVIALLTVQNTTGVSRVQFVAAALVHEQLAAVLNDIRPNAAKTGALGSAQTVTMLAEAARNFDFALVVDPVMAGKHGHALADGNTLAAIRRDLLPRATLITPNLEEAAALTGREVLTVAQMRDAARALVQMGAQAALVKGGHLADQPIDVLLVKETFHEYSAQRVVTRHTHGTGCTYSAAITAGLAHGRDLVTSIALAKEFLTRAIASNPGLGKGSGPLNHWA